MKKKTRTFAVSNQKGGSGKTTTAVSLSAALGEAGKSVLLVDLDPQASATTWFAVKNVERGIYDCLTGNTLIKAITCKTLSKGVDVVPASTWLVGVEKALAAEVGAETILKRRLAEISGYDYIMLDCPPSLGLLTVNALTAAGELLIPVETHIMGLAGLAQLLQTFEYVKERLNSGLCLAGILACRADFRTRHAQDIIDQLRKRFPKDTLKTVVRENVRLAEAPSFGQPITQYDTGSHGAQDYRALAREIIGQEN